MRGERACGHARGGREGGDQAAERVERGDGGEHGFAARVARDPLRETEQTAEHFDVKAGERQIRPFGRGGDVDHHQPALPALVGGDQRRAVGQPRPSPLRQIERGFGQHLPPHPEIVGNFEAREGRAGLERRQAQRLFPGHRSAEGAAAQAQRHGHEIVVRIHQTRAREPDDHAAPAHPRIEQRALGVGQAPQIGE